MSKTNYTKNFKSPDELREFEKGKVKVINMEKGSIGFFTLEPGWRWSNHVKPIVQTPLCEAPHFSYQISGRLHVLMADGTEFETVAGDVAWVPPGHDAWVVGNEPVQMVDWSGAANYAKK